MNLEKMAIKTRLRTPWQAIDLGLSLARTWWLPLHTLWLAPAAVLLLVLNLVIPTQPGIAIFIVWWLKPFWDRLPLYFASRALFNDAPTIKTCLKQTVSIYKKDCLPWLLWRRFSLVRSFVMPVTLLEGQKGSSRARRIQTLQNDHTSAPFWLTIVLLHFEQLFPLALLTLIYLFIPEWEHVDFGWYWEYYNQNLWAQWAGSWLALFSMSLMAPLYTMGGFMAYINRRIALEGWDIEIRFRAMANRLKPSATAFSLALVIFLAPLVTFENAEAQEPTEYPEQLEPTPLPPRNFQQQQVREEILKVVSGPEFFQTKTVTSWRLKENENSDEPPSWLKSLLRWLLNQEFEDKEESSNEWNLGGIAGLLKLALIALVLFLVLYLIYRLALSSEYLRLKILSKKREQLEKPDVIFGLEVTPESIPDNVGEQALALLNQGKIREALGLLYRASLSHFIHTVELPLFKAQTELECANTVETTNNNPSQNLFFKNLTFMWLQIAYAHRQPNVEAIRQACSEWSDHFKPSNDEAVAA